LPRDDGTAVEQGGIKRVKGKKIVTNYAFRNDVELKNKFLFRNDVELKNNNRNYRKSFQSFGMRE